MARLDEDWDFSAEELDLLEQDAMRKIAERKSSSATAGASCCSPSVSHLSSPASASIYSPCHAAPSRTSLESRYDNADVPSGLLDDISLGTNDLPQLSVRLYLHSTGLIAAKFSYSPILVQAVHKVPKASWRPEERLWLFPLSFLKTAEQVFSGVSGANVELQSLDPLACRALACANAARDLSALYDRIPSYLESKLLPFQREGVSSEEMGNSDLSSVDGFESDDTGIVNNINIKVMVASVIFLFLVVVFVFFLYLYARNYWGSSRRQAQQIVATTMFKLKARGGREKGHQWKKPKEKAGPQSQTRGPFVA